MANLERTDKSVSILLEELETGILGLPEIQRNYVWNKPQARDLIDSLYRQYPTGLILLWRPKELPKLRDTSISPSPNRDREPDFLILDGQQRLTSLKKVFTGDVSVYFHVKDEAFQIFSSKLKADPLWVSVKDVLTKGAIQVWHDLRGKLNSLYDSVGENTLYKYLDNLNRLERIKDYRYPVMVIHTDDYEEITESFIRINSKGTKLREAELAMAQLAFHWPGSLVEQFEKALDEYEQANFDLEGRFLMRCYVAIATGQSGFKFLGDLWRRSVSELNDIWKKTKSALDHTINFIKNNAGLESSDWVPSANALIPLIAFFAVKNGRTSDEDERGLLFWFYEATIHGRFTASVESKLDQDLKAIKTENPVKALITNIKRESATLEITPEMVEGNYQRHPFLPLLFAVVRGKGAKDWFTGTVLSSTHVGGDHQLDLHHIFPKSLLKKSGIFKPHEIDDLANIAFLSRKADVKISNSQPKDYLRKVERARLESQFIPPNESLWSIERFRDFLKERRNLITRALNDHLKNLGQEFFK